MPGENGGEATQAEAGAGSPNDVVNPEILPPQRMERSRGGPLHFHVPTILRCPAFWFAAGAISMGVFVWATRKER